MFIANFFVVFLLGLQSRNVNEGQYIAAVITSFGISVSQFLFVKYAANGDIWVFLICAMGGCCGIAFSIWFYKWFSSFKATRARNGLFTGGPVTYSGVVLCGEKTNEYRIPTDVLKNLHRTGIQAPGERL